MIHRRADERSSTSRPHYNAVVQGRTKRRGSPSQLPAHALQSARPEPRDRHSPSGRQGQAAALISGPEYRRPLPLLELDLPVPPPDPPWPSRHAGCSTKHWDNGKFHKAFTFVRPENEVALALLRRYGYEREHGCSNSTSSGRTTCVMEKPYTKVTDGL